MTQNPKGKTSEAALLRREFAASTSGAPTMTEATTQKQATTRSAGEGKYLTFALAQEEYGLEILKVREIIGYIDVTTVPQTPHHVKGVINLRGQVIPVIDLRAKFGMETTGVTDETCIIVVEINQAGRTFSTGILVDRVQEVLEIAADSIEDAPQFGASVNIDFISGMAKVGGSVKILLDIDRVLAGNIPENVPPVGVADTAGAGERDREFADRG